MIVVRPVAVLHGNGCFETTKPILVKWIWNTLTQRLLQVVRNTKKKILCLGVKLQVRQQKKRTHRQKKKTHRTEEKGPSSPFT